MKVRRSLGFMLFFVVLALAMVTAATMLLSGASNSLHGETQRMFLDAHHRNLQASGLAWAVERRGPDGSIGSSVELGAAAIAPGEATILVAADPNDPGAAWFEVRTFCQVGRSGREERVRYAWPGRGGRAVAGESTFGGTSASSEGAGGDGE